MKSELIDIHAHITPGIDDGAANMEMALHMLRIEADQGCRKLFLTPHSSAFERCGQLIGRGGSENIKYPFDQMKRVQEEAAREGIPIQIYQGCEIYTSPMYIDRILRDLKSTDLPSMNNTKCILAEFSVSKGDIKDAQYCLSRYLDDGWTPIIAHAERYCRTFATVKNIRILREMGCLVQANYYDLDEEPDDDIRTCAQQLLKAELVDMMGTDAHRTDHRPPKLERGTGYIRENCRVQYAEDILFRNAQKYLKVQ